MKTNIKWVEGLQFIGESESGHKIVMDSDIESGGTNKGMKPTELLLIALGGCSGMDVISLLQKKRQQIKGLEINVKGDKAENYPKKFTNIEIEYVVSGVNISEEAVARSIELSMEKYCSVKASLEGVSKITSTYRIIQVE